MADIIAIKVVNGRTVKQRWNENAWKNLGSDKNGWVETTPQTITNTIESEKSKASGKDQVIDNTVKKTDPAPVQEAKKPTVTEPTPAEIEIFMKHIEGFNKGTIKDFFDSQKPPIEYDNRANLAGLKKQLGDHFKYDIVKLQTEFT